MLRSGPLVLAALLAAGTARAQEVRRVQPTAFPASVAAWFGMGFGGQRAAAPASANACLEVGACRFKLGSGPMLGVDLQLPVTGTLGVGVSGGVGRPAHVTCATACTSTDKITAVHASLLLLWRFKARAPIYFGVGPTFGWLNPGPVQTWDTTAVTELGGALVVGYDFRITPTVGGRLAWWNYLTKPSDANLPATLTPSGLAWDKIFSFGLRFGLRK